MEKGRIRIDMVSEAVAGSTFLFNLVLPCTLLILEDEITAWGPVDSTRKLTNSKGGRYRYAFEVDIPTGMNGETLIIRAIGRDGSVAVKEITIE